MEKMSLVEKLMVMKAVQELKSISGIGVQEYIWTHEETPAPSEAQIVGFLNELLSDGNLRQTSFNFFEKVE